MTTTRHEQQQRKRKKLLACLSFWVVLKINPKIDVPFSARDISLCPCWGHRESETRMKSEIAATYQKKISEMKKWKNLLCLMIVAYPQRATWWRTWIGYKIQAEEIIEGFTTVRRLCSSKKKSFTWEIWSFHSLESLDIVDFILSVVKNFNNVVDVMRKTEKVWNNKEGED